jgi:hypothetical protein
VTLELTLEELNEKTVLIESIPALLVFVIEIIAFPTELSWVSAVSGLISGICLGRKTSGGTKKDELVAQKRGIEEEMEKLGGRRLSLGGTLRGVESVFGAAAAREMEAEIEEDLGDGGDVELAELPGAVDGGEDEEEGGSGESLRAQLDAMRERAEKAEKEVGALRKRARGGEQRN